MTWLIWQKPKGNNNNTSDIMLDTPMYTFLDNISTYIILYNVHNTLCVNATKKQNWPVGFKKAYLNINT